MQFFFQIRFPTAAVQPFKQVFFFSLNLLSPLFHICVQRPSIERDQVILFCHVIPLIVNLAYTKKYVTSHYITMRGNKLRSKMLPYIFFRLKVTKINYMPLSLIICKRQSGNGYGDSIIDSINLICVSKA